MGSTIKEKLLFFGAFTAVGVYFAEVSCFNLPSACINPFAYLAYGLLYVLYLDSLMKHGETRFPLWYLFGFFVGFISETYGTKVTFLGLQPHEFRVWGIAPGAVLFVIMFYHAYFSFLTPAYLSARLLGMPFPLPKNRLMDVIVAIAPFFYAFSASIVSHQRNWLPELYFPQLLISAGVMLLWLVFIRKKGSLENVLFMKKERNWFLGITIIIYTVFFFILFNDDCPGRELPALMPLLTVSVFTVALFWLMYRSMEKKSPGVEQVSFDPAGMDLKSFVRFILWQSAVIGIVLFALRDVPVESIQRAYSVVVVPAVLLGAGSFLYSLGAILFSVFRREKQSSGA